MSFVLKKSQVRCKYFNKLGVDFRPLSELAFFPAWTFDSMCAMHVLGACLHRNVQVITLRG